MTTQQITDSDQTPTAYVGVGASAGGVEAIGSFISQCPTDSGAAFILIQHLSPDHKSLMSEILNRRTLMPIRQAENDMEVEPNHIYLIPPRKKMSIFHGRLLLSDFDRTPGVNLAIDEFLQSLAVDQGNKSIAVILSGAGSDGQRGIQHIKEQGGLVLVQDSESAPFESMPTAAAETGLADLIGSPEFLAQNIAGFLNRSKAGLSEPVFNDQNIPNTTLSRVFALLRTQTGVDFSNYKPTTVLRRLERRVLVNHLENLEDYLALLNSNDDEAQALYRELLIGVTAFFRDSEAFDCLMGKPLEDAVKHAASQTDKDKEFRVWVAGCSTGEEAYSIAIALEEVQQRLKVSVPVKIFATDLDQGAISTAQQGVYPASIASEIPKELLSRYFVNYQEGYQVARAIREQVIFARHNLMRDPPFTNTNLVTCRNVLIYFTANMQHQVLDAFHLFLEKRRDSFLGKQ